MGAGVHFGEDDPSFGIGEPKRESPSSSASISFNDNAVALLHALTRDEALVELVDGDPCALLLEFSDVSDMSELSLDHPPPGKFSDLFCTIFHIPSPPPATRRELRAPTVAARISPLLTSSVTTQLQLGFPGH